MGFMARTVRVIAVAIGTLLVLFALLLLYLWASGRVWYPRQRRRVEELESVAVATADEVRFAATALADTRPLNLLRVIATHNSYHHAPGVLRKLLIGLVEPDQPDALSYSHRPLWEQLEDGIRSFELDVRARRTRFTITHVPLVDNRGPHPDFSLALREIVLWSERRPGHVPIVVLLELKSDYMFLDPGLIDWDAKVLDRLDQVIRDEVPTERLLTPDELLRGRDSLSAVPEDGWPALGEVRDRILMVMHTNAELDPIYSGGDPSLSGRAMFTSSGADALRPDALFVIHNTPDLESIQALVDSGHIVRTRADAETVIDATQRRAALRSSAQIVSTDYPPDHPNEPDKAPAEFGPGMTLRQMPAE